MPSNFCLERWQRHSLLRWGHMTPRTCSSELCGTTLPSSRHDLTAAEMIQSTVSHSSRGRGFLHVAEQGDLSFHANLDLWIKERLLRSPGKNRFAGCEPERSDNPAVPHLIGSQARGPLVAMRLRWRAFPAALSDSDLPAGCATFQLSCRRRIRASADTGRTRPGETASRNRQKHSILVSTQSGTGDRRDLIQNGRFNGRPPFFMELSFSFHE
jgi:hypothetical protein